MGSTKLVLPPPGGPAAVAVKVLAGIGEADGVHVVVEVEVGVGDQQGVVVVQVLGVELGVAHQQPDVSVLG